MTPSELLALIEADATCQRRTEIVAAAHALNLPAIDHALRRDDGSCTEWRYVVIPALRLALESA